MRSRTPDIDVPQLPPDSEVARDPQEPWAALAGPLEARTLQKS